MKIFLMAVFAVLVVFANKSDKLVEKALSAGLAPLDAKNDIQNKPEIELGKKLFFDPRISNSNQISCNSCHNLALGGSNAVSQTAPFNTNVPTIFNVSFDEEFANLHLFNHFTGDLRVKQSKDLQQKLALKIEMFPLYIIDFKKSYGNNTKIDFISIAQSIGAFQSTLITQSRYDDFLRGWVRALSKVEREGLEIFINKDCTKCHNGKLLGGKKITFDEFSAYKFAKNFKQNESIKVPTLRNVTQTAPYFKNGKVVSLMEAIALMTKQDESLSDDEISKIEAFFNALEGHKPSIIYPQLPY